MATDFDLIIETCRAEAIASKLSPTSQSDWRYFCRQYSEKFSTPLHVVLEMDPEFVILHVYESRTDSMNIEEDIEFMMENIYAMEDPEYYSEQKKEQDEFVRKIEEEEEERLRLGEPIPGVKKKVSDEASIPDPPQDLPTEGYLNLSYLEDQDQ